MKNTMDYKNIIHLNMVAKQNQRNQLKALVVHPKKNLKVIKAMIIAVGNYKICNIGLYSLKSYKNLKNQIY